MVVFAREQLFGQVEWSCDQPDELHNTRRGASQRQVDSRVLVCRGEAAPLLVQRLQPERDASPEFEREFQVVHRLGHEPTHQHRKIAAIQLKKHIVFFRENLLKKSSFSFILFIV